MLDVGKNRIQPEGAAASALTQYTTSIVLNASGQIELGEGPVRIESELFFLDIVKGRIFRYQPTTGSIRSFFPFEEMNPPPMVGAIADLGESKILLAAEHGVFVYDLLNESDPMLLAHPELDRQKSGLPVRYNDGKIGPDGPFMWAPC